MNELKVKGKVLRKTDAGFEQAIRATIFNQRDTGRMPEMMIVPQDVDDVIAAIHYAKSAGLRISVCSGGHSWSHNHLRPGSLLINMKGFNKYEINREAMTATAGPGCGGSDLLVALMKQGLFFPAGHCKGVCIGGYLLQGGFAYNGRKLGMACESVIGLDIVTAGGELIHASATENPDLFWAARGSGGGFFGVVVRFHLRLYPKPKYCGMAGQVFDIKHLETVFNWAYEVGPEVSPAVEFQLLMSRKTMTVFGPGIEVFAPIFADTRDELEHAQAFLRHSPIKKKAFLKMPFMPVPISWMYSLAMTHYPYQYHWGVDNMWTGAHVRDLMPYLKKIAATLPPAPAHVLWLNWQPPVRKTPMAFSMEDKIYLALYGSWKNAADTAKYGSWATDWMREMQHLGTGIQLADESLHTRAARFVSDENLQRLDVVRAHHDPARVFHEWHSRLG